jgi:hydroxymethylbilane synthase
LAQHRHALDQIEKLLPVARFGLAALSSPGDRDRAMDLRVSPPDFFSRDLDVAVLEGRLDCALHSAKDVPDPLPPGLDWCWLPWREDPRDVWVLPAGKTWAALPAAPVIGVSSARREAYARCRYPQAVLRGVRGNIAERLAQLDAGGFDLLVMAGAALVRLGLQNRISAWLALEELATPEGQGVLTLTFREGDATFQRLRSLFVKPVTFVGTGDDPSGAHALRHADVCLHDVPEGSPWLGELPATARKINVGPHGRQPRWEQDEISRLLARYARQGCRVVRLCAAADGWYAEVAALDALRLPYRILPNAGGSPVTVPRHGALQGGRVLLTCSAALLEQATTVVQDFGGVPLARPLIRLVPKMEAACELTRLDRYGWLLITSPSAVRCLAELLPAEVRRLPRIMVCGPGTAAEVEKVFRIKPDFQAAADFGKAGVLADLAPLRQTRQPVLRIRSDQAGSTLADELRQAGLAVTDLIVYKNERVRYTGRPEFDAVFFASASAVEAYVDLWGADSLGGRTVVAIGKPTAAALNRAGSRADVLGHEATVASALAALAAQRVNAVLAAVKREHKS